MSKFHGRNVRVWLADSGAVNRDISIAIDTIDVPSDQDIVDVAGFGDSKKNYVTGLADSKITMNGNFDDTATTGAHAVLTGLIGGTAGYFIQVGPKGTASGYPRFSGSYLLDKYSLSAAINGAVKFTSELVPFGTAGGSWGTFP